MKYQVDICLKESPHDDPDGAKYESHYFESHKEAVKFATANISRDVYGEVRIHHYTEDKYGKEFYPEDMEIIS
jgi:hypothetical protein